MIDPSDTLTDAEAAKAPAAAAPHCRCQRYVGRVAVVTGAGSGIGRATALRLAAEGASVAILDIEAESAQETAALIGDVGLPLQADISSLDSIAAAMHAASDAFGHIDLVHANAGIHAAGTQLADYSLTDWRQMIDVNLTGTMLTIQSALPMLERRPEASVVVTSSGSALRPRIGMSAYIATKSALEGLVRASALELASAGIRVNGVAPGPTRTGMMKRIDRYDGIASDGRIRNSAVPLGYVLEPADLAAAVAFLGSSEARYITGVVLSVDGGRHL